MANSRVHLIVKGWVQGVFFRSETQKTANGLGLSGWVRNRKDGSVEIVAEGPKDQLEKINCLVPARPAHGEGGRCRDLRGRSRPANIMRSTSNGALERRTN